MCACVICAHVWKSGCLCAVRETVRLGRDSPTDPHPTSSTTILKETALKQPSYRGPRPCVIMLVVRQIRHRWVKSLKTRSGEGHPPEGASSTNLL